MAKSIEVPKYVGFAPREEDIKVIELLKAVRRQTLSEPSQSDILRWALGLAHLIFCKPPNTWTPEDYVQVREVLKKLDNPMPGGRR